jgi:hypothetical protein
MTALFNVSSSGKGLSRNFPARSAKEIRHENPKSGVYWIQPTGSAEPLQIYCDMETDDGGWMCVHVCWPRLAQTCYNANAIGGIPTPFSVETNKVADTVIQNMLNDGERITRTFWFHVSTNEASVFANGNLLNRGSLWNEFEFPFNWNSTGASSGQRFKRKEGSNGAWTGFITALGGGCSGAAGGWSNYYEQQCVQSWFAGCEGGPAINHACANPSNRAQKLIVWVR